LSQQVSYEQYVLAESRRRYDTDYRFSYLTYVGWNILTIGFYSIYATYKMVERRTQHAERRLAFLSYFWHTLNARAESASQKEAVAEGLDNLSRIYQQIDAFERRNKRSAILMALLRLGGYLAFFPLGVGVSFYTNHFLNKDLRFFDEWESSYAANAEWVMQRLGYPISIPRRMKPVQDRSTGLYAVLSIITAGIWSIVWRYKVMVEGNAHFDDDDRIEDALLGALGITQLPPSAPVYPPGPPMSGAPGGAVVPPPSPGETGTLGTGAPIIPPPDDPTSP